VQSSAPPMPLTLSTSERASYLRASSAISRTGLIAPVLVSECATVTAAYPPVFNADSTASRSTASPGGAERRVTWWPHDSAMLANRSENDPLTSDRILPCATFRTAASIAPVPDAGITYTGRAVKKTSRRPASIVANMFSNSRLR
jgi:hypothetical protein